MIKWFRKRYFDPKDALEYRVFMIFFFECFLLSTLSGFLDGMLDYGIIGFIVQWGFNIACVVILMLPKETRMKLQQPTIIFIAFVFVPFLYLQSAGHDGSMIMFGLLAIFMISFMFQGKKRNIIIMLNMLLYMALVWAGFKYPDLVILHGSEEARMTDLIMSVPMCFIALATMAIYVSKAYRDSNQSLAYLATKDEITGTYNRRSLSKIVEEKLAYSKRTDTCFAIMMLDIDFFKMINDTYGHGFGDEVLQRFSSTVQNILRKDDILARYGGEEFVLLVEAKDMDRAVEIAERIRTVVQEIVFDNGAKITVSIGVTLSKFTDTEEQLLVRVDKNLYKAKETGRNKVVC